VRHEPGEAPQTKDGGGDHQPAGDQGQQEQCLGTPFLGHTLRRRTRGQGCRAVVVITISLLLDVRPPPIGPKMLA
jgi:hypothetical protein